MKKVEIYKVEYVINGKDMDWVACIAGFNGDDVTKYLEQFCQPNRIVVNSITTLSRLDGVTDEVRELIAQPFLGRPTEAVGEETVDETKPQKRAIIPKA